MATKTKKAAAKTETKTTEQKVEANGSYEFLVQHFAEPSSIIDAATMLAQHNKIDAQIATKKVEQFLENAKIDQSLEVRAGTGSNEGQFIITRVPQNAQRKNGGREVKKATEKKATEKKATEKKATEKKATEKKATEKKATEKKATEKKATEKKTAINQFGSRLGSQRAAIDSELQKGTATIDSIAHMLVKHFGSDERSARARISIHIAELKTRKHTVVKSGEHGTLSFSN